MRAPISMRIWHSKRAAHFLGLWKWVINMAQSLQGLCPEVHNTPEVDLRQP